jgi:hypothetical protein
VTSTTCSTYTPLESRLKPMTQHRVEVGRKLRRDIRQLTTSVLCSVESHKAGEEVAHANVRAGFRGDAHLG